MDDMIEVKDGLLATPDKSLMKARDPVMFPERVQEYFEDVNKIKEIIINPEIRKIVITTSDKKAFFDPELFNYIYKLSPVGYYLSNVPLPGEGEYYTLFAEYDHGWCVLAPLED